MKVKKQTKINNKIEYGDWEEGDLALLSESSFAEAWLSHEDEEAWKDL